MSSEAKQLGAAVKDPVCGMMVNPATAKNKLQHAGKDYYFCCRYCVEKFQADPDKYLQDERAAGVRPGDARGSAGFAEGKRSGLRDGCGPGDG